MTKPIGLAEYKLTESLPEDLQTSLPTIEELEAGYQKTLKKAMSKILIFELDTISHTTCASFI